MKAAEILFKSIVFLHWKIVSNPAYKNGTHTCPLHQELKLIKQTLKLSKWPTQAKKYQS